MNIRDIRALKDTAALQLSQSRNARQVLLVYAGVTMALALLVTAVNYVLDLQIANFGGLSNLGTKSMLSTIQMVLPMLQSLVILCLELGYQNAMLRVSRGQYVSPNSLRLGFDRFWPLLRTMLMQSGIYLAVMLACCYLASMIFTMSPFSESFMTLMESGAVTLPLALDAPVMGELILSMIPMLVIYFILLAAVLVPMIYSYRMANYVIVDNPGLGGLAVLRQSKQMMRGSRRALLKLDFSFWWYYVLNAAVSFLAYGDVFLPMLGIQIPWSDTVSYFLFYALFLAAQMAIYWFFLNRVSVAYALAYEAVRPEKKDEGVVLGNIFRM